MKIVIWSLLIVGVYFVYQLSIGKVFNQYQSCYDSAMLELASQTIPQNQVCVVQKLTYEQMNNCIATVQQSSNFSGFLYQAAPVKKLIDTGIDEHNEACLAHPIEPPQQSFYVSTGESL